VPSLRVKPGDYVVAINNQSILDKTAGEGLAYIAGSRWPRVLTLLRQEIKKKIEKKYDGDPVRLFIEWPPICRSQMPHDVCSI
jgi:hypothetical protein